MELPKKKLSKKEILDYIAKLKKDPGKKARLLTDLGIAGAGMAGAGAVAAVAGASVAPIGFGITALTGLGIAVAAPVTLVAGAAVVGGAAAYGVTQAVRYQSRQHGTREQMIQQLNEILRDFKNSEQKSTVTDTDKNKFTLLLEEPLKLNLLSEDDASDLIVMVESGQLSLMEAYRLVKDILEEFQPGVDKKAKTNLPLLLKDVG